MKRKMIGFVTSPSLTKALYTIVFITILLTAIPAVAAPDRQLGVNVLLNTEVTDAIINELNEYGKALDTVSRINAVHMKVRESDIPAIEAI